MSARTVSILAFSVFAIGITVVAVVAGGGNDSIRGEVEQICDELGSQAAQVQEELTSARSSSQALAEAYARVEVLGTDAVAELNAIEPPPDQEDELQAIIAAFDQVQGVLGHQREAVEDGDLEAAKSLEGQGRSAAKRLFYAVRAVGVDRQCGA